MRKLFSAGGAQEVDDEEGGGDEEGYGEAEDDAVGAKAARKA